MLETNWRFVHAVFPNFSATEKLENYEYFSRTFPGYLQQQKRFFSPTKSSYLQTDYPRAGVNGEGSLAPVPRDGVGDPAVVAVVRVRGPDRDERGGGGGGLVHGHLVAALLEGGGVVVGVEDRDLDRGGGRGAGGGVGSHLEK